MSTAPPLYLERIDADRRMARFYAIRVERTLFGEWAVIYRWGRIGCKGQRREQWLASWDAACAAAERQQTAKLRRGYRARPMPRS